MSDDTEEQTNKKKKKRKSKSPSENDTDTGAQLRASTTSDAQNPDEENKKSKRRKSSGPSPKAKDQDNISPAKSDVQTHVENKKSMTRRKGSSKKKENELHDSEEDGQLALPEEKEVETEEDVKEGVTEENVAAGASSPATSDVQNPDDENRRSTSRSEANEAEDDESEKHKKKKKKRKSRKSRHSEDDENVISPEEEVETEEDVKEEDEKHKKKKKKKKSRHSEEDDDFISAEEKEVATEEDVKEVVQKEDGSGGTTSPATSDLQNPDDENRKSSSRRSLMKEADETEIDESEKHERKKMRKKKKNHRSEEDENSPEEAKKVETEEDVKEVVNEGEKGVVGETTEETKADQLAREEIAQLPSGETFVENKSSTPPLSGIYQVDTKDLTLLPSGKYVADIKDLTRQPSDLTPLPPYMSVVDLKLPLSAGSSYLEVENPIPPLPGRHFVHKNDITLLSSGKYKVHRNKLVSQPPVKIQDSASQTTRPFDIQDSTNLPSEKLSADIQDSTQENRKPSVEIKDITTTLLPGKYLVNIEDLTRTPSGRYEIAIRDLRNEPSSDIQDSTPQSAIPSVDIQGSTPQSARPSVDIQGSTPRSARPSVDTKDPTPQSARPSVDIQGSTPQSARPVQTPDTNNEGGEAMNTQGDNETHKGTAFQPVGTLMYQNEVRFIMYKGVRICGGVRVILNCQEEIGYVQLITLMSEDQHESDLKAETTPHDEFEEYEMKRRKRCKVRKAREVTIDHVEIVFLNPEQRSRFQTILDTVICATTCPGDEILDDARDRINSPPYSEANADSSLEDSMHYEVDDLLLEGSGPTPDLCGQADYRSDCSPYQAQLDMSTLHNQQSASNNQQPTMYTQQPAFNNQQPTMYTQQPTSSRQQPTFCPEQPELHPQQSTQPPRQLQFYERPLCQTSPLPQQTARFPQTQLQPTRKQSSNCAQKRLYTQQSTPLQQPSYSQEQSTLGMCCDMEDPYEFEPSVGRVIFSSPACLEVSFSTLQTTPYKGKLKVVQGSGGIGFMIRMENMEGECLYSHSLRRDLVLYDTKDVQFACCYSTVVCHNGSIGAVSRRGESWLNEMSSVGLIE